MYSDTNWANDKDKRKYTMNKHLCLVRELFIGVARNNHAFFCP